MAKYTESRHPGEHIVSEANGKRSRELAVLALGENLAAGAVLGKNSVGAASSTADADNTGNGTMGTITVGSGASAGDYQIIYLSASDFEVEDPSGVNLGTGTNGTEFSAGGIAFTITAGATAFAAGDVFTVTIAAGTGEYKAHDPAATDGSEKAAAVLYAAVDASAEAQPCVIHVRDCEVHGEALTWLDTATAAQIAAGTDDLAAVGIIVR
jgi:hypothetical protein